MVRPCWKGPRKPKESCPLSSLKNSVRTKKRMPQADAAASGRSSCHGRGPGPKTALRDLVPYTPAYSGTQGLLREMSTLAL